MPNSERLPRKLAAILYADVAGYSRLTAEDEDATHRRLTANLDLFAASVKQHGGRVMHYAGDAVLARFDAVVDAVSCAVDVQRELALRNVGLHRDQRVEFRIGVNLGDVIEDRGDAYGDGVNVAARLESLAGPGEICVAESVRTALGKRLPLEYEDLGEQNLKNIDHPVRAYRLRYPAELSLRRQRISAVERVARIAGSKPGLAAVCLLIFAFGLFGIYAYLGGNQSRAVSNQVTSGPAASKSVAVLPFADISESGEQTWVADGLAEEILNSLAHLPELKVTARTSSFQFRNQNRDIGEIAARLGVANVLEGSVRVSGDQLRVTAQLIRGIDGFHVWSNVYDGNTSNLLEFQRDVAERVAAALDVALDESRRARMFASGTQNVEAFKAYQEGWKIYNLVHSLSTDQTLWDANKHFERAIALDPRYAQAAIGRTDAFGHLLVQPRLRFVANSPYSQQEALTLLQQNLDFIAANSTTATMRVGAQIHRESFSPTWYRMPGLFAQLRQQWDVESIAFDGGVDSALFLPNLLLFAGQHDLARALAESHVTSDPLSPDAWFRKALVEIHAREFDAARAILEQARRNIGPAVLEGLELTIARLEGDRETTLEIISRQSPPSQATSMFIAATKGDYATAMSIADEMQKQLEDPPGMGWNGLLLTYYEMGERERLSALVKRIDESLAGAPIFVSWISNSGNALFFGLEDAPNFVAKLNQARIDPGSFEPMPRLSAPQ